MVWKAESLITLIATHPWGVPVKDMETLMGMGGAAVPALVEFLDGQDLSQRQDEMDLLWPVVLLGELGDPRGIPQLLRILRKSPDLELVQAASEGLSKCGEAALEHLEEALEEDHGVRARIFAYGAMGRMASPSAFELLERMLARDPELDFVVARGLAEGGGDHLFERIYTAYLESDPWKRPLFEEILSGMACGALPWSGIPSNWRIRYRRRPQGGMQIPPSWPAVLFLLWESRAELYPRQPIPLLSRGELHGMGRDRLHGQRCPDCGRRLRRPTGVPLCDEVEEDLIGYQIEGVRQWRSHRWEDLHEVLDELDYKEVEILQWAGDHPGEEGVEEALDAIDVMKKTLYWMVECGLRDLAQGEAALKAELDRARARRKRG